MKSKFFTMCCNKAVFNTFLPIIPPNAEWMSCESEENPPDSAESTEVAEKSEDNSINLFLFCDFDCCQSHSKNKCHGPPAILEEIKEEFLEETGYLEGMALWNS